MFRYIIPVLLLLLLPEWSKAVPAPAGSRDCVALSMKAAELWLEPGKAASVVVSAKISKGWWIYGVGRAIKGDVSIGPAATEIRLLPSDVVSLDGKIEVPKPKSKYDDNFQAKIFYYKGQTDFTVPIRVSSRAKPGAYHVALLVSYMACDTTRCFPPVSDTLRLTVMVESESESMLFRQNEPRRCSIDGVPVDDRQLPVVPDHAEPQVPVGSEQRMIFCRLSSPVFVENKYFVTSSLV